jgi:iron complex outermembrane receptor protein
LSLDFNVISGHVSEDIPNVSNTAGSQGNLISSALSWNPTMPFKDAAGLFNFPTNGSGNPLALIDGVTDEADVNTVLANVSAGVKILDNLEYKFLFAINHSTGDRNTNLYGWLQGYTGISGVGWGLKSAAELTSQTFTHTLNYKVNLTTDLSLDAIGGFEYWKTNFSNSTFGASGFNTNLDQANIIDIPYTSILRDGNTQFLPTTNVNPTSELQSYFARAVFNYRDKYYITGTIRRDGSSKFGENNKYGNFPSVAARWVINNEDFLSGNKIFNNLALRASWGKTGNQEFPEGASQEQFSFSAYNTASQINVANPDLKWESTESWNIGLDFAFSQGRFYGSLDYYNKTTTDILFQSTAIQPAPSSIYFINIPGDLTNKGIEFAIGAALVNNKDFGWDLSFNISNNKNNLTNFYAPGTKTPISILTGQINGQGVSGTLAQIITNDQPVNEFWLKPFSGYDSAGNQIVGANPDFAGDPNPHTLYGISTTLRYQKFTLTINGGGAGGFLIYNNTATNITNLAGIVGGRNIDRAAFNSAEKTTSGVAVSTRFLEKGDYFKLRNVSINYGVGNVGKYVRNLNLFVNATNLFVMTDFTGFDPEVNIDKSSGGYPSRSIEYVPYPTPRTISFGLNLSL